MSGEFVQVAGVKTPSVPREKMIKALYAQGKSWIHNAWTG